MHTLCIPSHAITTRALSLCDQHQLSWPHGVATRTRLEVCARAPSRQKAPGGRTHTCSISETQEQEPPARLPLPVHLLRSSGFICVPWREPLGTECASPMRGGCKTLGIQCQVYFMYLVHQEHVPVKAASLSTPSLFYSSLSLCPMRLRRHMHAPCLPQ